MKRFNILFKTRIDCVEFSIYDRDIIAKSLEEAIKRRKEFLSRIWKVSVDKIDAFNYFTNNNG